jgi:hypothetical protein
MFLFRNKSYTHETINRIKFSVDIFLGYFPEVDEAGKEK